MEARRVDEIVVVTNLSVLSFLMFIFCIAALENETIAEVV